MMCRKITKDQEVEKEDTLMKKLAGKMGGMFGVLLENKKKEEKAK